MIIDTRRWHQGVAPLALAVALMLVACSGGDGETIDASHDIGVDMASQDVSPDVMPDFGTTPCGAGADVVRVFSRFMVICEDTKTPHNQCMAETLCNTTTGWSLCTASQYEARSDHHGSKVKAWLKACVRDSNSAPTTPTDALCVCKREIGTDAYDVAWSCTGVPLHQGVKQAHIAVITDEVCHRVGTNVKATEGFWATQASYVTQTAAVCCK
ncbi:MAG: hypothetical protein KAI47_17955 [Deltaproteobacteria bacterium]|nr:hypothetical protein [Deltaproteobacteria bacterium]